GRAHARRSGGAGNPWRPLRRARGDPDRRQAGRSEIAPHSRAGIACPAQNAGRRRLRRAAGASADAPRKRSRGRVHLMTGSLSLAIDIGGTFTDIVLHDHLDGRVFSHKELTTPQDPTEGTIRGIRTLFAREGIEGNRVSRVIHATTLFTNALIERRGARTGLITTAGFRDTLEMRREFKYDLYDLFIEIPDALIPRALRLEVTERVRAGGAVDLPLNEDEVLAAGRALAQQGVESIAVAFLHAYANPAHERRARAVLERHFPQLYVSISSEVSPQIREFERTSTTAVNLATSGSAVRC